MKQLLINFGAVRASPTGRTSHRTTFKGILICQGLRLNVGQILEELQILETLNEKEPIIPRLEALLRKHHVL